MIQELFLPTLPHWTYENPWSGSYLKVRYFITVSDGAMHVDLWDQDISHEFEYISAQFSLATCMGYIFGSETITNLLSIVSPPPKTTIFHPMEAHKRTQLIPRPYARDACEACGSVSLSLLHFLSLLFS